MKGAVEMKIQLGRASAGHTLLRYFLSYFLVAGILLLSFVLIAYNLLAGAVSERIYAQTEQRLDYVASRLEAEFDVTKYLKPGEKPMAEFKTDANAVVAREYCNLHGLWKGE